MNNDICWIELAEENKEYNKIKDDDVFNNQEAIDSALEELEAEINKNNS
tara:strand:+ start:386 stop:532 length:147 start_codon:yes stop_codon:yes gene_type:complete